MNEPQKLIGHGGILEMLLGMHSRGKLAHALLFLGPGGVGKRTLAGTISRVILEVQNLETHPDFTVVSLQLNDKGDLKKQIGVEQIRDLRAKLQMSSFGGAAKIALIDGADLMTVAAQNALLKTLEDPSGRTHLILMAEQDGTILPTVLSRCQTIHVPLVSRKEISEALTANGLKETDAYEVAGLAAGRPGRAIQMTEDEETLLEIKTRVDQMIELMRSGLTEKLGQIAGIAKDVKGQPEILDAWELVLHDLLLIESGSPDKIALSQKELMLKELAKSVSLDEVSQILRKLEEARDAMKKNVNPTLALEHVFI